MLLYENPAKFHSEAAACIYIYIYIVYIQLRGFQDANCLFFIFLFAF